LSIGEISGWREIEFLFILSPVLPTALHTIDIGDGCDEPDIYTF
jgi:hypothetical protein